MSRSRLGSVSGDSGAGDLDGGDSLGRLGNNGGLFDSGGSSWGLLTDDRGRVGLLGLAPSASSANRTARKADLWSLDLWLLGRLVLGSEESSKETLALGLGLLALFL